MTELEIRRLLVLVAAEDPAAADALDALADDLRALAATLRARVPDPGFLTPSGMTDRVKISVTGPTGETTRTVDTHPERRP